VRLGADLEIHPQRFSRLKRPVERVDKLVQLVVDNRGGGGTIERDRPDLGFGRKGEEYYLDRYIGGVDEIVRAPDVRGARVGVELDTQVDAGEARLRDVVVSGVAAFIFGAFRDRVCGGFVLV
jgi:hypothetical protein